MKYFDYHRLTKEERQDLCQRPKMDYSKIFAVVQPIVDAVREKGDCALLDYTQQFDGVRPDPMVINPQETTAEVDTQTKEAIDTAFANIYTFHQQ